MDFYYSQLDIGHRQRICFLSSEFALLCTVIMLVSQHFSPNCTRCYWPCFRLFFRPESSKFLRLFDMSDTICAETLETRKKLKLSRRVNDIEPRIIKGHWPNFRRRRKKGNIPQQLVWHYCASIAFTDVWLMNGIIGNWQERRPSGNSAMTMLSRCPGHGVVHLSIKGHLIYHDVVYSIHTAQWS